jgi:WD40 repeat protein
MTISPTKATLEVWDPSRFVDLTQPTTSTAPPGSGATTSTAVDPEGRMLAVGTDSGAPWFVDLDTRRVHASSASGHPPIVSIGFFDDGRQVVTTDALGAMAIWDPRTGAKGGDVIRGSRSAENPDLGRAVVAPDGRRVATSVDGFGLRIIDAIEGTVGNRAYPDLGAIRLIHVLGWTPDGRYVIVTTKAFVSGRNGTTPGPDSWALVDPVSGDVVWATEAPEATVVTDAVFVEDGRTAIVPGQSGQLYSLDTASGRLVDAGSGGTDIVPPGGERRPPKSLSVTEDGQLMAVVSVGSPVEIRNVTSGTPTASLAVSPQTASTHFLSNDELVTVTSSGAVLRFELSADDWLRSACAAAGRELTESEWAQFLPEQPYRSVCGPAGEGA